ncbi:hypothetical protein BLOT_016233 [Blomia tropicalis]|nr:hypothetical protein BLOT_016233 [Blomia tropicalis]
MFGRLLLLLLLLILQNWIQFGKTKSDTSSSDDDKNSKICDKLKDPNSIMAIGRTDDNILLITKDLYLYHLPMKSLDNFQLILSDKPKKLSKKVLKSLKKKSIYSSFIGEDGTSQYIFFVSNAKDWNGAIVDIKSEKTYHGIQHLDKQDIVYVSSSTKSQLYELKDDDKGVQIARYEYKHEDIIKNSLKISEDSLEWSHICDDHSNKGKRIIITKDCNDDDKLKWKIERGFNDGKYFYLFESKIVYIFPIDSIDKLNNSVPIIHEEYGNFFVCKDEQGYDNGHHHHHHHFQTDAPAWLLTFVFLITGFITLLFILIYCCCCKKKSLNESLSNSSRFLRSKTLSKNGKMPINLNIRLRSKSKSRLSKSNLKSVRNKSQRININVHRSKSKSKSKSSRRSSTNVDDGKQPQQQQIHINVHPRSKSKSKLTRKVSKSIGNKPQIHINVHRSKSKSPRRSITNVDGGKQQIHINVHPRSRSVRERTVTDKGKDYFIHIGK